MPPYNIACVHAQNGNPDEAFAALKDAVEKAPDKVNVIKLIQTDTDLASLRPLRDFSTLR
jgi:hypothetical protein